MHGIINKHHTWRVAVVGAVINAEVTRIANVAHIPGLDTTLVTRYCFTSQSLTHIDELFAYIAQDRYKEAVAKPRNKDENNK